MRDPHHTRFARRAVGRLVGVLVAAFGFGWSAPATAQVTIGRGCSTCGPTEFEAFMRLGPTFSGAVSLTQGLTGLQPGAVFRVGTLAGLPVQVEASVSATLTGGASIAGGLRVLPLAWVPGQGIRLGGGEGVSVGAIGGITAATTFYVGLALEVMPLPEFGLVAEFVQPLGGILSSPPSFNVGVKVGLPRLREEWR